MNGPLASLNVNKHQAMGGGLQTSDSNSRGGNTGVPCYPALDNLSGPKQNLQYINNQHYPSQSPAKDFQIKRKKSRKDADFSSASKDLAPNYRVHPELRDNNSTMLSNRENTLGSQNINRNADGAVNPGGLSISRMSSREKNSSNLQNQKLRLKNITHPQPPDPYIHSLDGTTNKTNSLSYAYDINGTAANNYSFKKAATFIGQKEIQ